jgi:lactate/malate dehydrogenase, NAD binding domain
MEVATSNDIEANQKDHRNEAETVERRTFLGGLTTGSLGALLKGSLIEFAGGVCHQGETRIPRIAIVGAGFVGSTAAYALMMSGVASEIALISRDQRRAQGHVNDLRDAGVFPRNSRLRRRFRFQLE